MIKKIKAGELLSFILENELQGNVNHSSSITISAKSINRFRDQMRIQNIQAELKIYDFEEVQSIYPHHVKVSSTQIEIHSSERFVTELNFHYSNGTDRNERKENIMNIWKKYK